MFCVTIVANRIYICTYDTRKKYNWPSQKERDFFFIAAVIIRPQKAFKIMAFDDDITILVEIPFAQKRRVITSNVLAKRDETCFSYCFILARLQVC